VDDTKLTVLPWMLPINAAIDKDIHRRREQAEAEYSAKHAKGR
jgi:hypothetical protein